MICGVAGLVGVMVGRGALVARLNPWEESGREGGKMGKLR